MYPECAYPEGVLNRRIKNRVLLDFVAKHAVTFKANSWRSNDDYWYVIQDIMLRIPGTTSKVSLAKLNERQSAEDAIALIRNNVTLPAAGTQPEQPENKTAKLETLLQQYHAANPHIHIDLNFNDALLQHAKALFSSTLDRGFQFWDGAMATLKSNPVAFLAAVAAKLELFTTEGLSAAAETVAEGGDVVAALASFLVYFSWVPVSVGSHGAILTSLSFALRFQRFLVNELAEGVKLSQQNTIKSWLYPYEGPETDRQKHILRAFATVRVRDPFVASHGERLHPFVLADDSTGVPIVGFESTFGNETIMNRVIYICGHAKDTWQFDALYLYVTLLSQKVEKVINVPWLTAVGDRLQNAALQAAHKLGFRSSTYLSDDGNSLEHVVRCVVAAGDAYPLVKYTSGNTATYVF